MKTKDELRKEIFIKRSQLTPEYRQAAQAKIYQALFDLDSFQNARTIMVYYSTAEEFDTQPIIQRAWDDGKVVGVPRVYPKRILEAHKLTPDTPLELSKFKIQEPISTSPIIDPEIIDLIIMPCVTCNNQGERLGYGGGYYDRYLLRAKNAQLVLPYFAQLQMDTIPTEAHDMKVQTVITEEQVTFIKQ